MSFDSIRLRVVLLAALAVLGAVYVPSACGQDAEPGAAADRAPAALPSTKTLPESYPVITVKGECPKSAAKKAGSCDVVITREEFEELIKGINPRMTKRERRDLAENYGRMLALSQEATREGLDRDPGVKALMRYVRTSALGGAAYKKVYRESSDVPESAVEQYYRENRANFEKFNFQRIFIPREKQGQAVSLEQASEPTKNTEAEMKAVAEKAYARAAAGEDFVAVQKDVAKEAGINHEVNVALDDMVRGSLPKEHNTAFELAPGGVSQLIQDSSGYYIYKLVSKELPSLDTIRTQVTMTLQNERLGTNASKFHERAKVNAEYFDKYDPPAPNPNEPEVDDD